MLLNNHNLNSLKLAEKVKDDNASHPSVLFWLTPDGTYVRSYDFIVKTSYVKTPDQDYPDKLTASIQENLTKPLAVQADSLRSLETHEDPDENLWLNNTAIITKIEPVKEDGALIPSDSKIIELSAYNPITQSKNTVEAITINKEEKDLKEELGLMNYYLNQNNFDPVAIFAVDSKKLIKLLDDLSRLNNEVKICVIQGKTSGELRLRLESRKNDPQDTENPIQEKVALIGTTRQLLPAKPVKEEEIK